MFRKLMAFALVVVCFVAIIASAFPEPQLASSHHRPWWGGGHGGWGGWGGWGGGGGGGWWGHGGRGHGGWWGHHPHPPFWHRG